MGGIDLDPFSTPLNNQLVVAARIFDCETMHFDDICSRPWAPPGQGRLFLGTPTSALEARRLMLKTLREYRLGHIKEAVIWSAFHENMPRHPWIWDFPVCIPFRRLRPCWFDTELNRWQPVNASMWSFVLYLPPVEPREAQLERMSRFHVCFSPIGRIVYNEYSGEDDWLISYRISTKRTYDFRK